MHKYACFWLDCEQYYETQLKTNPTKNPNATIAHHWYNSHFISINTCGCEVRTGVQVSKRELHTHIHLDYVRVEFLSCINKNK